MIRIFIKLLFTVLFWFAGVLAMTEYNKELLKKSKMRYLCLISIWVYMFGIYCVWAV